MKENVLTEDKLNIFELLENMNHTISRYISGVALDALLVFIVVFVGYMVLGIPYAFLLHSLRVLLTLFLMRDHISGFYQWL